MEQLESLFIINIRYNSEESFSLEGFDLEKLKQVADELGLEMEAGSDKPGFYYEDRYCSWEEILNDMSEMFPFLKDSEK